MLALLFAIRDHIRVCPSDLANVSIESLRYPVCDAVTTVKEKMATRPDLDVPDVLSGNYDDMINMYLGSGSTTPRDDPRLSPGRFKKREDLPEHIYLIGAEHDLLCSEAKDLAERLVKPGVTKQETKYGWQAGGVRWDLVKGQTHGFDQFGNGKVRMELFSSLTMESC